MTYIDDANAPPQKILDDAQEFFDRCFPQSDEEQVTDINADFEDGALGFWLWGELTSSLVQMHDLVAPLNSERAGRYLQRLGAIAGVLLNNRDDTRGCRVSESSTHSPNRTRIGAPRKTQETSSVSPTTFRTSLRSDYPAGGNP